jgi:hypothetical protein
MAVTLPEARRVVEREREECVAEREAFERFRAAVARLDGAAGGSPSPPESAGGGTSVPAGRTLATAAGGAADAPTADAPVPRAYRATVLAVDHVDAASVVDHMVAELGPDLARAACDGRLTPGVRAALAERIDVVVHARDSFVDLLDREAESLAAVESTCERVRDRVDRVRAWESVSSDDEVAFDAALAAWDHLDDLASTLDDAARERQATLARHRRSLTAVDDDATGYLYGCRPALSAVAAVGRRIDAGRGAVVDVVGRASLPAD